MSSPSDVRWDRQAKWGMGKENFGGLVPGEGCMCMYCEVGWMAGRMQWVIIYDLIII